MEKFISFEKLSKKKKKELNSKKRKSWNGASPVTKKAENKKRYNRKKSRIRDDDFENGIVFLKSCCFFMKLFHALNLITYRLKITAAAIKKHIVKNVI